MLHADYITAIETRLRWLKWAQRPDCSLRREPIGRVLPQYLDILERADTYCMVSHFERLVDHARRTIPDSTAFDARWLQSPCGWLYLKEPIYPPLIESVHLSVNGGWSAEQLIQIAAVGWRQVPAGEPVADHARSHGTEVVRPAPPGTVLICCFITHWSRPAEFFFPWSFFLVRDGVRLGDRVASFEEQNRLAADGSSYVRRPEDLVLHPLHEIRWEYAAFYLMAQRLAVTVRHETDRHTRRRAERDRQQAPPFVRVITLRRLEAARQREAPGGAVDWRWQWEVRGHWRNQFYPSESVHKPKFIEAYVKGPPDRPLKDGVHKLFAARR